MSTIELPDQWVELVARIQEKKGTVVVLGAPDSGKTTLARFLVRELSSRGEAVAYLDGDMGQSILGPPTTLGLVTFDRVTPEFGKPQPRGVYFIGSTSPRGHGLETIVGLKRLLEMSQVGRERVAVLDTTGYVTGAEALELKYQKMDLLNPRHIVAVQQGSEIEAILATQEGRKGTMIHRLPSSPLVQTRSQEERRRYRWNRFQEYFETLRLHRLDLQGISLTGTHRLRVYRLRGEELKGLLLGLNGSDNYLMTLGILETIRPEERVLSCLVPSTVDLGGVRTVRLGSVRIDLSEEENGESLLRFDS